MSRRDERRWRTPRSAVVLALMGGVLALQLGPARSEPPVVDAVVVDADGDLDLQNSLDGIPILSASGLAPGDTASGQVTLTNAGTGSGQFSLKRHALSDTPGAGGGALSERLQLLVSDVTVPDSPTTVYSGTVGAMPTTALGTLGPAHVRTYRFEASLPEGGSADNAYAGSSTSVGYKWTVASGGSGEPPIDPPVDPPAGPPAPPGGGGGTLPNFVQPRLGLKIKLAKAQKVKRKRLMVRVRCTQACSISIRGQIRVKRVKKPLGKTKLARKKGKAGRWVKGKPGRWVKVRLKLSKKTLARMALAKAKRRKLTLKVTVNARTANGSKAKAVKAGRIK